MKLGVPAHVNHPDADSKNLADRLHCAILNGKVSDVVNLLDIGKLTISHNIYYTISYNTCCNGCDNSIVTEVLYFIRIYRFFVDVSYHQFSFLDY